MPSNDTRENQDLVPLTGMLSEFRTALLREIDAATSNMSSSAVPLVNGRKIAQLGQSYQYFFEIENALNLPGDTPGDLYIPGKTPIEVTVISIEGMGIILSIPENLGKFVPNAKLQSNLAFLMRKLIERIEAKADTPNPTGDRVLGNFGDEKTSSPEITQNGLNNQQYGAVLSSLSRNITFIGGPPGTGKTETIGHIGKELFLTGRATLLVSHTNTAVDGAIKKIGKFIEEIGKKVELTQGKVIRVGVPKDSTLDPELLLDTHVKRRSAELTERKQAFETELADLIIEAKENSRILDIYEWAMDAGEDILSMEMELNSLNTLEKNLNDLRGELNKLESQTEYWADAAKSADIAKGHLLDVTRCEELLKKLQAEKKHINSTCNEILEKLAEAESILNEVNSISWVARKWKRLPSPEEQMVVVEVTKKECDKKNIELDAVNLQLEKVSTRISQLGKLIEDFKHRYNDEPDEIAVLAIEQRSKVENLRNDLNSAVSAFNLKSVELHDLLKGRFLVLIELGLIQKRSNTLDAMLESIREAHTQAISMTRDIDYEQLLNKKKRLNCRIQSIESELKEIEELLKRVEDIVIKDALIVATTLTRAYLKDSIQARMFDTVILDEASMAPIPALWMAASVAEKNAVVVGDPKQLPPIVISEHALAEKWLGRDIFKVAGLDHSHHPCLVNLKRQYRMHPQISSIANALIYQGELEDDDSTLNSETLNNWYRSDWGHDNPVLLVDTSSVGAWVTSVARGKGASRLNFLSATICMDLVEQILKKDRDKLQDGKSPRILVASPYRPHAQLVEWLIHEQKLENEVRAGTAHSFQGSEADVVIFDFVNDEPQWRVAMFMPQRDESIKKLLNVALTRAKHRLILVGDFEYMIKCSKKAFLGAKLIPFLLDKFPLVDSLDIVKSGLAAKAARAQASVLGGDIEATFNRIVVTQESFYRYLRSDFAKARSRIVVYSPFITENRVAQLESQIKAAVERGVEIFIITKPHCDRNKREIQQYRILEDTLTKWGTYIVHKQRMHEKLIFIDDNILWDGSLNPLSFKDTEEHMERRVSKKVFSDYAQILRLSDLIGEYTDGKPNCPICGQEVVACEGKYPFYWRCIEKDCYTRSIGEPAPKGGAICCHKCGGEVEYGEWGGKPSWRCKSNRRHHQKVARTHLRLPKMRALIPKQDLKKLYNLFNISTSANEIENKKSQPSLFD